MLGGRGRDTPADLTGTTDAGKRDAGEAKKGEVREDKRDIEQEGGRTEIADEDGGKKRDEDAEIKAIGGKAKNRRGRDIGRGREIEFWRGRDKR